jgi:c-di-GMP-related signal transduction protein
VNILSPLNQAGTRLVHVGRQPIFDTTGDVVAYELLFRGSMDAVTASRRDAYATSEVVVNTFTEFGIEEVVGDRLCFINLTRDFLVGELALPFGPENVVLEVLETVEVDDEVVAGVEALVGQGYTIALDDFVWGSGHERLLPFASYVKLDLLNFDVPHLDEVLAACREYPGIQIVAEGLETGEHLALSNSYGFELRQGYVLSRPQVLTAAGITPSKMRRLEMLATLCAAEPDMDRIVSIVGGDPALAIRVLRASNSAAAGATNRISSVRQAVVMLGVAQIRRWAVLMVVEDVSEAAEAQLVEALTRARLCQNLAGKFRADPDAAFMTGLITAVADLLHVSPASMAHKLPLAPDIDAALQRGAGPLGQMLRVVDAYQRGDVAQAAAAYEADNLTRAVMEAMRWASQAVHATQVSDTAKPS